VDLAGHSQFRRRLVFLEDYDVAVARYLVQGADVWLNTPLRPMEASGTSGMKALANGALNLSTLDGWWDEAWRLGDPQSRPVGWAIGKGEMYESREYQDQVEAEALYNLLERDVVPTFYDRRADGLPRQWIARMKSSIATLCPLFNMHRLVKEYTEGFYLMAHARHAQLTSQNASRARALAGWLARVREAWTQVRVSAVEGGPADVPLDSRQPVRARIQLGSLKPEDVAVELYIGRISADGDIIDAQPLAMHATGEVDHSGHAFEVAAHPCCHSGLHGYTVRVLPYHPELITAFLPGLIVWPGVELRRVVNA
jgi:starch phosphorylase